MNRNGYAVMQPGEETIIEALQWDYDYMVFQNRFFLSNIYVHYPEFLSKVEKIADNGKLSICRYAPNANKHDLLDFMGFKDKEPAFLKTISAGLISPEMEFGFSYKSKNIPAIRQNNRILLITSRFNHHQINNCYLAVSINSWDENLYYKSYNLKDYLKQCDTWEDLHLSFYLPQITKDDYEIDIHIWNPEGSRLEHEEVWIRLF
jgi:hypothetical protein